MDRDELIMRKEAVRAEITQIRRRLAQAHQGRGEPRQSAALENQLEALMAEARPARGTRAREHRLRLLIDRSK